MFKFPPKQPIHLLGEDIEFVSAGSGAPTIVLVNGAGGPIEGWHKIFGPLSERTNVFAYNRPGMGGSGRAEVPQVGSHMVRSLRALLQAAHCSPPFVLVGHSMGGLIVNLFARQHPDEVSAVVFIEATAPTDISVLAQYENRLQRFLRLTLETLAPPNPHAEGQHARSTVAELMLASSFPPVPLTVITGGKHAMAWATDPKAVAARATGQEDLARLSPRSTHTIAPRSGHFPQFTESHLVVSAVLGAAGL